MKRLLLLIIIHEDNIAFGETPIMENFYFRGITLSVTIDFKPRRSKEMVDG